MKIEDLQGQTLQKIKGGVGNDELEFETVEGKKYKLYHEQDCCESVEIADIAGDLNDLIGSPLLQVEEVINRGEAYQRQTTNYPDSQTYTFYRLATRKGAVTIRWIGESNGYYSESVDFKEV